MEEIVYHTNFAVEDSYWWFTARNLIFQKIISKKCHINKNEDVLDVGCGTGGVLKFLSASYNMIGLDMSSIALDYCRKRGLVRLYNCSLSEFDSKDINLKAITFFDVIEHIDDDVDVVKSAYNLLPKGAFLIASVPAYQWLWSKHDEMHQHKRRYSKKSFSDLITGSGFSIDYISYFNSILMIPAVLKRFLENVTGSEKKIDQPVDKVPEILNKLFHYLFAAERFILPALRLPFGLSIIVVAQKK
ncbi:MAG: class I SAM-dependent methyltransferase [Candidatus Kapabacteria bacterium]|nr:class I SAM-dependent methyltransferase [Candidatus Kapabacteria bacterium]